MGRACRVRTNGRPRSRNSSPTLLAYQDEITALAVRVLRAFAAALEQPEDIFAPIYTPAPNPLIKIIRYPGRASGESDQGVGAHKDSGFVTLLLQEKQAGLQVQGDDGGWIDAPPVPGSFVVNIGEILEMASNGYLRANVHRVVSPPQGSDRLSVALFLGARHDATVPLLSLPPQLAAQARGVTQDPHNPLFREVGRNYLKSRLRSHPDVARRHYADLIDPAPRVRTRLRLLNPLSGAIPGMTNMAKDKRDSRPWRLHGGAYRADPVSGAVAVPIYQTTSYQFQDTGHASRLFALEELGNIYTRVQNPTWDALETAHRGARRRRRGARGRLRADRLRLFGAQPRSGRRQHRLLDRSLWRHVDAVRADAEAIRHRDPLRRSEPIRRAFRRATDAKTRAYYAEILPNPKLNVFPISEVADIGRSLGVPLIADNTATPLIARPFEHGAAVVVYSATKYIGGHGTSIGGLIIDGGNFPWEQHAERFPLLTQPDEAYHGAIWTEAAKPLGPIAYALARARQAVARHRRGAVAVQRLPAPAGPGDAAAAASPAQRECDRGRELPRKRRSDVSHVIFPGLQTGETRRRADAYLKGGYGGLVGFELKGGVEAGRRFIDSLKLLYHVANIGDARSLAIHPASTTHQQLTPEEQLAAGVTPGYVRLSVGLEHPDDILADLVAGARRGGPRLRSTSRHARRPDLTLHTRT